VEIFDEKDARIWDGFGSMDRLTDYCHHVKKELAHLNEQDIHYARAKVRDHYSRQRYAPGQELPLPPLSDMEWKVLETNPDELLEFFWHIARTEADAKRRGKGGCVIGNPPGLLTFDDLFDGRSPPCGTGGGLAPGIEPLQHNAQAERASVETVLDRCRRRRARALAADADRGTVVNGDG
jgi:hypothetical protein